MTTLGQRLEELRISNRLTKKDVARIAQVTGTTVDKWEKDQITPRDDKIKRLAKYYDVSFEWLRVGVDSIRTLPVSESSLVSIQPYRKAMESLFFDSRQLPIGHSQRLVYIVVDGNSMGDILPSGSILIIDIEDTNFIDEKMYVFKTHDFVSIRTLSFTSTGVRLQPIGNQKDELLTFQQLSKMDVLGRVITSICPR